MTVIDCIMFAYEDLALKIRLEELRDVVDYTVIVQANTTFRGDPRKVVAIDGDKIINIVVDLPYDDPWDNEKFQRDATVNSIRQYFSDDTLAIVADADEIINPQVIRRYRRPVTAKTDYREWYADWRAPDLNQPHCQPYIAPLSSIESAHDLRMAKSFSTSVHVGWHLSSLGNVDLVQRKLSEFAHSEYDTDYWKDKKRLQSSLLEGRDLLDRFSLEHTQNLPYCIDMFPEALGGPI